MRIMAFIIFRASRLRDIGGVRLLPCRSAPIVS